MSTPVKDRLRSAALAYTPLTALIGQNWFDNQLPQEANIPAIVAQQISVRRLYNLGNRPTRGWWRFQLTVWGGQFSAGAELRGQIRDVLIDFITTTLNLYGIPSLPAFSNYIDGDRDALFVQTNGPVYQQLVDVVLFVDETI